MWQWLCAVWQVATFPNVAMLQGSPTIEQIIAELRGEGECTSTGVTGSHASWVLDQLFADFRGES